MTLVSQRPGSGPPRDWRFPAFQRRTVSGGRVLVCHLPERPLAVVSLVVETGAANEPPGCEGVAELVMRSLSEGTTTRDAHEFAVAGERLGASWRSTTDWDSLRCGFEVAAAELPAATRLLTEAVRHPALAGDTLSRVRDERLDEVLIERSQPGSRGMEAFAATVFTEGSRYARSDGGTTESLTRITDEEIREFHAAHFVPDRATLVLVGDLDDVDVDAVASGVFDGWDSAAAAPVEPVVEPRPAGRRVIVVDRPGSVQSMLCVGHDGPPRSTPDYVPLTTMSLVLGGMFSSRLNLKLREEKGYAYGAFGGFDTRGDGGVFICRAAVQNEVTVPALVDLVHEIERIQAGGVEPAELEQARSYRAGVFPLNFAGSLPVAAGLAEIAVHGFADDHYDRLRADVLEVGKPAVDEAAGTRLRPADLSMIVVGSANDIVADLRAADLGPVEVISDEA